MSRSSQSWTPPLALIAALAGWGVVRAGGHEFQFTDVTVLIKSDHSFLVDLTCDLDELLLGIPPGQDSRVVAEQVRALPPDEFAAAWERLTEFFRRRVRIEVDDQPAPLSISFPEHGTHLASEAPLPSVLGVTARLSGRLPAGGRSFVIKVSAAFPPVRLTIFKHDLDAPHREILPKGVESTPFSLDQAPAATSAATTAWRFFILGFEHILPLGPDHILFVLGLYLLSTRWRPLLWQVTTFTLAHTVTLALALYGVVSISPRIVEPLIALSIAYVGVESLLTRDLKPWRPAVIFLFGLLHGLGFAGVLVELRPPRAELATALLSFNIGVEFGQLAVIGLAFLLSGWWRKKSWYRTHVTWPASALIAAVALYWTAERILA